MKAAQEMEARNPGRSAEVARKWGQKAASAESLPRGSSSSTLKSPVVPSAHAKPPTTSKAQPVPSTSASPSSSSPSTAEVLATLAQQYQSLLEEEKKRSAESEARQAQIVRCISETQQHLLKASGHLPAQKPIGRGRGRPPV